MKYKVIIENKVAKVIENLPKSISKRIIDKIELTRENPFLYFVKLINNPCYKLRIGKYRIIADISKMNITINIIKIDKRGRIYKQF